jgi:hypothetical protein
MRLSEFKMLWLTDAQCASSFLAPPTLKQGSRLVGDVGSLRFIPFWYCDDIVCHMAGPFSARRLIFARWHFPRRLAWYFLMAFVMAVEAVVLVVIEPGWVAHRYIDEGDDQRNDAIEEYVLK